MRITIAGHGTIGHYVEQVFGAVADVAVYDPPLGLADERVLRDTDFVFVCVPTPSGSDGACDTSAVEDVVSRCAPRRAVIIHSTVAIGTTDRLAARYAAPLVFAPEYAGEAPDHPMRDPRARTFFVFGGEPPAARAASDLFRAAYGPGPVHHLVTAREAEVAKYMENAFLAAKVAFCNEFFDLCGAVGADFETVRRVWLADPRIGASHTVVTPERGYGGGCLPKDVDAVIASGAAAGAPMEILEAVRAANARHRGAPEAAPVIPLAAGVDGGAA